jgi:hypothetical protein
MSVNYENIDFRLNTLYDYVYNKNTNNCYEFKQIVKNKINLIDIKQPSTYNSDHIFHAEFKYIGSFNNRDHFKRISNNSHNATISFGHYSNNTNIYDIHKQELYNMLIMYILSEAVCIDKLEFILLPIMMFDTNLKNIKENNTEVYDLLKSKYLTEDNNTTMYVIITENYFQIETLEEYILKNNNKITLEHWKTLFFQIIFTLHKLGEKILNFRHNMLNLNSIRICTQKQNNNLTKEYKIKNHIFHVNYFGFDIKITDFDLVYGENIPKNKLVKVSNNPYYDIHYFFNSLYIFLKKNKISVDKEIYKFIDTIIPSQFKIEIFDSKIKFQGLNEILFDSTITEIITPLNILIKNKFFSNFIDNNMNFELSPIKRNKELSRNLTDKISGINYLSNDYSITDNNSDTQRLLGKIYKNKNSNEYNNKNKMIKRSRNVTLPDKSMFKRLEKATSNKQRETNKNKIDDTSDLQMDSTQDSDSSTTINKRLQSMKLETEASAYNTKKLMRSLKKNNVSSESESESDSESISSFESDRKLKSKSKSKSKSKLHKKSKSYKKKNSRTLTSSSELSSFSDIKSKNKSGYDGFTKEFIKRLDKFPQYHEENGSEFTNGIQSSYMSQKLQLGQTQQNKPPPYLPQMDQMQMGPNGSNYMSQQMPPHMQMESNYMSQQMPPHMQMESNYMSQQMPPHMQMESNYMSQQMPPHMQMGSNYMSQQMPQQIPQQMQMESNYMSQQMPPQMQMDQMASNYMSQQMPSNYMSQQIPPLNMSGGSYSFVKDTKSSKEMGSNFFF